MSSVLTFDLGTTYFKVCVFDESLRLLARKRIKVPVENVVAGRAELPVPVFCDCLVAGVQDVSRQLGGLGEVTQVCFASQANTFTLLDARSRPLLPFILWTDERAAATDASLNTLTERPDFYATTGIAQLNHEFMIAKLLWLREHEPERLANACRVCSIAEYLVLWLTGNFLTEAGLSGLTGLSNIHTARYRPDALQLLELPEEALPTIARAGSDAGQLRPTVAGCLGLPNPCRLVMGCLDQYAGAIGADNVEPGRVSETTGTVLATVRCAREFNPHPPPGVFQGPAFAPGLYYQMVFSDISAVLLEEYRDRLEGKPSFEELDLIASRIPAGAEGLSLRHTSLPRGGPLVFDGRNESHGRGHEVRAILEAVAVELRRQVTILCGEVWPELIRAAGGAARSRLWLQIKSDMLGCPVIAVDSCEPTSKGAAQLAHSLGR